ncbi:DUF3325 domain-containing protein [Pandoraea pnomenusa]|uniref:DUF3325 domain-containing protein n=1 Tax=Pandoraea pnomenusa TaxID=93220 RepID=UPI003342B627
MMAFFTFAVCLAGFAGLALATERQQTAWFGGVSAVRTRRCRIFGWASLAIALAATVSRLGWGFGLVNYSGQTSLAAGVVYLALIAIARRRQPD